MVIAEPIYHIKFTEIELFYWYMYFNHNQRKVTMGKMMAKATTITASRKEKHQHIVQIEKWIRRDFHHFSVVESY